MPIYEYQCPGCGHEFDKIVKFSDPAPPCPSCGHGEVTKKVSQTSFQLKGSGWYVTDYKSRPGASTSPSSSGDSGGGDSSGGDSSGGDSGGGDSGGGDSGGDSGSASSSGDSSSASSSD